jgi:F-type H+-transporting ATPase subunit a
MSQLVFTHRPSLAGLRWGYALVLLVAMLGIFAMPAVAQEHKPAAEQIEAAAPGAHAEHAEEHHGLTTFAPPIFWGFGGDAATKKIGPFAMTNSMIVTWIVAIGLIIFAQVATRQIKDVPDGAQNFWEWLVESLHDFLESIIGHDLVKKTFWFFATLFIFILFTNWAGLFPGVGTIGWGTPTPQGGLEHITTPLFRGVNADLNMTLAMATIFFACWIIWALQANGPGGFILHIFGPKGKTEGFMKMMMIVVFALVGVLEVVSIMFRPVSLSFRLYGNVFAGENMLESMAAIVPGLSWLIPVPFYFMELLVGLVQALVFMLLTAVFTLLICQHEEGHH